MLVDLKSLTAYYHLDDDDLSDSLRPYLEMAALITNSDVSYISTFDDQWQYFLSINGAEMSPIKRETSICNLTLKNDDLLVIEDMDKDPRKPGSDYDKVGFYVGMPIIDHNDITLGTFCMLGAQPTKISDNQKSVLRKIGTQIIGFLERRRDLKNYYEVWKESNAMLEREWKRIGEIKSKLAHDFKGPLGNLKAAGDLVKERQLSSMKEYMILFDQSQNTIDHLVKMTQGLTEELLFEKSKQDLHRHFERISFRTLIEAISEVNKFESKYSNVSIEIEDSCLFNGPYLDLFLVFQNLIENGLKYNKSSQRLVKLSARENRDHISFKVIDNGLGIPNDQLDTIFEKGVRVHEKEDIQGTGLGLNNVSEIVRKYNGKIWVTSEVNQGSVFHIELPSVSL